MCHHWHRKAAVLLLTSVAALAASARASGAEGPPDWARAVATKLGISRGICVVLGLPGNDADRVLELARATEAILFVQSAKAEEVAAARKAAETAGMLGSRIYADRGRPSRIPLADNFADAAVLAGGGQGDAAARREVLRVLRPGGRALIADQVVVKPAPKGTDAWRHPYHGPDNNPQSTDRLARAPYLTQFLARPMFSSQPEVTVAAGGRVFKAFGHIAFRAYQNEMINRLLAMSAYNGTILWERKLKPGFMIHRNTLIATPEVLYLADDESCKLIDAATGRILRELVVPADDTGDTVWKWMALDGGVLHALVGGAELKARVTRGRGTAVGGWPWGMWPGYDYQDEKAGWGFGRTLLAMDPKTGKVLWRHRQTDPIDSRGVCMGNGRIYFYSRQRLLGCRSAADGQVVWRTSDPKLLEAIGPDTRAQQARYGFTTSTYVKCSDKAIFFAGPQRARLVAASAEDGKLLWQQPSGNYQLVLRPDALYAMSPGGSLKIDYASGKVLQRLVGRQACTRATGSIDSIFVRGRGTVRYDPATGRVQHINPMRPACHDGVVVSDGMLYWGPWICGCPLALFGVACLTPAGDFDFAAAVDEARQLEVARPGPEEVRERAERLGDWRTFRGDNQRRSVAQGALPEKVTLQWTFKPLAANAATAPVVAGGIVLVGGSDGAVRAVSAKDGKLLWKDYTGGRIYFPPVLWNARAYVGSNDGWVYAFEAATGRALWRFRVAPMERRIRLYDELASTWPVSGGVLVEDGVVYAAAGVAPYDGTHVCALDAVTGKVRWHNNTSGAIDPGVGNGASVNGPLYLDGGNLCFHGGNVYPKAMYDLRTGKCLNRPAGGASASQRVIFYPREPGGALDAIRFAAPGGLVQLGRDGIGLYPRSDARNVKPIWSRRVCDAYQAVVKGPDALLVAGVKRDDAGKPSALLARLSLADGSVAWSHPLPAAPVTWGLALDANGRIIVSLEDGQLLCFAAPG